MLWAAEGRGGGPGPLGNVEGGGGDPGPLVMLTALLDSGLVQDFFNLLPVHVPHINSLTLTSLSHSLNSLVVALITLRSPVFQVCACSNLTHSTHHPRNYNHNG